MTEIARLVVDGWPISNLDTLEKWLFQSIQYLKSNNKKVKFLITPGGFSLGNFPKNWNEGFGWNSPKEALSYLLPSATPIVDKVISRRLLNAAKNTVKYITLNVDLRAASTPLHAELIALIDVNSEKVVGWTGKSYPTMKQEHKLIHVVDPTTHLFELGPDRVIILGCHDLNVFNGRAIANQKKGGSRYRRCQKMLKYFNKFSPTHIIQHPHGTDTWRSWNGCWKQVEKRFPGVSWASAITYAANNGKRRAPLVDVLNNTHCDNSDAINIIFKGRKTRSLLQRAYVPAIAASR